MKRNRIRLSESQLHRIIEESVKSVLNEIGDTERGQYALGAAQARRDWRQRQDYQRNPYLGQSRKNGDIGDEIGQKAQQSRAKMNGGDEFDQDNMETYYKAKNAYNANQQGYRNYMSNQSNPGSEDYRTAKIRH